MKYVLLQVFVVLNDSAVRMPFPGEWCKVWIYFGFVFAWAKGARPRFDTSTDMGLVLIPADAEVDSVIFRLRATDQDADFPLVFEITATITPVVRIDNLPCTLYNKVCQANVILTKRLVPGRLHDFAVRVRDTKGDSNSMQATISVTNATTPRDKIFPHIPSLIMVPEDTKPGKELDYLLVRANSWSGKPVYIELWQPKELFTIRQRQTPIQTRGVITLIGELDFETQSMYTLTMYATDPYTEPGKDTRNIAGLSLVVVVQDVQDVPPIFTLAPPLTRINNSVQPGDTVLRVHAEDGDKGVPREIVYGLVSENNPFTPFFNISETSGEIVLARPLEELTQITHVGAPIVLTVVAEEIRRSRDEPPAQATVVDVGFLLGEPGNSPPYFESDNYIVTINENLEPGTVINFGEQYSTRVKDEDIGKAGVFALKLENNNGTFEINPTVAERTADFIITVRDNTLIDYELHKVLSFKIVAQEVGPATNLSTSVPVTIFLRDVNDNAPIFEEESYEATLSENVTAGTRVVQVHAIDKDTGAYGSVRYTSITGDGSEAFAIDPDTGLITVAMGSSLDREMAARLVLSVEARDENGSGNRGMVPLIINLLDVNDNAPIFEKDMYEFMLNSDLTNFTMPVFIKAIDADAEPPNNIVRYELVHGNYENKFYLNETSGELILRSPITKIRRKKQSAHDKPSRKIGKEFVKDQDKVQEHTLKPAAHVNRNDSSANVGNKINTNVTENTTMELTKKRRKRANDDPLYTLTARAYDLGVPHLSSVTQIRILSGITMEARIMMFVVPGEKPDSTKTAETLAAITGGRVTVLETKPYVQQNHTGSGMPGGVKKSIVIARVEQTEPGTPLVDVEKIREALAANGVGIINGTSTLMNTTMIIETVKPPIEEIPNNNNKNMQTTVINSNITSIQSEEVTVYKAENKLLLWLLIILGLLMLLAIAILIICCTCPGCPFYMAPRKRRVQSSETLIARSDGRPKRHLHRQSHAPIEISWNGRKQAWSADPTRRNWQFNKRNVKNCSLPGDVAYISGQPNDIQMNAEAQRLADVPPYDHPKRGRMDEQERLYMEDTEGQKIRRYDTAELDSLHRHEMERGSDVHRHAYRQRHIEPDLNEQPVREQHFFREGNAEVLRLVTRGQVEDTVHPYHPHHRSTTLIVDGKDIILQRFIEDQKSRHELSVPDIEAVRSMESHQRSKEIFKQQPEIILIPEKLDLGHRQHVEEIGPNVQRLVIDHGDYELQRMDKEPQVRDPMKQERQEVAAGTSMQERPTVINKDRVQQTNSQYVLHDLELARQNALLTRLLLERENKRPVGGPVDSTSYLETQSLPGQIAIATQTDRTAATQTDRHVRSRSDNDESDEESKHRKKLKSRKKYGDGDWKRSRTLWMKSPIEEEGSPRFDKRLSILRKKVKEVKEGKKITLEPEVLREISDSLDGNGSSCKGEEDESMRTCQKSMEQTTRIKYKILGDKGTGSQSSESVRRDKKQKSSEDITDDQKMNVTESTSSPEIKTQREKYDSEKTVDKSPKKETKLKQQKKEGMIKPSFRILEKEFTMLTKKLSKLGDKKFQESTGSDSTSQEKSEPLNKTSRKELDHKNVKKLDISQKQTIEVAPSVSKDQKSKKQKEAAIAKMKQKLKYQQTHVMSTGSSEYDDNLDKPKKMGKQKQSVITQVHTKLKRQSQIDKKEPKKQMSEGRDEESEKRKHSPSKGTIKVEKKVTRAPKLANIVQKGNVTEETSTSTEDKKDAFNFPAPEKKSSSDYSDREPRRGFRGDAKKVVQKFSDNFVEEFETVSETETKQVIRDVKKEETYSKENIGDDQIKVVKNGLQDVKLKTERQVSSKQMASKDSVTCVDEKKQLIKARGIIDAVELAEGRLIEMEDAGMGAKVEKGFKSTPIESTIEISEKVKDGRLFDAGNVIKESEKDGMVQEKMESGKEKLESKVIDEFVKGTIQAVRDKLNNYAVEKQLDDAKKDLDIKDDIKKQIDDTKKETCENEKVIKEVEEESKKLEGAQKDLEERVERLFEDREKQKVLLDKSGDIDANKIDKIPVKQSESDKPLSDTHKDTEKGIDVKQERKDEINLAMLEMSSDKLDLTEKIDKPEIERYETFNILRTEDVLKQDVLDKPKEHEKEKTCIEHTDIAEMKKDSMKVDVTGQSTEHKMKEKHIECTDISRNEKDSTNQDTIDKSSERNKEEKHVEHTDTDIKHTSKEAKVISGMKIDEQKEKQFVLDTISTPREEITVLTITDEKPNENNFFLDKKEVENVRKIDEDRSTIAEIVSLPERKDITEEKEDITKESKTTDQKIPEEVTSFDQKQSFDEEKKVPKDVVIDTINKEEISMTKKEETVDKKAETIVQKIDVLPSEKEEITDITIAKQGLKKESTLSKEETLDKEEAVTKIASTADQKISDKEGISFDKEERKEDKDPSFNEANRITENMIKDYQIMGQDAVSTDQIKEKDQEQKYEIKDDQIAEKDTVSTVELKKESQDDEEENNMKIKDKLGQTSDQEVSISENIKAKESDFAIEKENISDTTDRKEDVALQMPGVYKYIDEEKTDSGETSTTEDKYMHEDITSSPILSVEDIHEDALSPPIFSAEDIKGSADVSSEEDQADKKEGIFTEMFTGVQSLVDTLTKGKGSSDTSTETKIMGSSLKISEEKGTSSFDDKTKEDVESIKSDELSASKPDIEHQKQIEEGISIEESKKEESMTLIDDKIEVESKDITEHPEAKVTEMPANEGFKETVQIVELIVDEAIKAAQSEQRKEFAKSLDDKTDPVETIGKEATKSSDDKMMLAIKATREDVQDQPSIEKESVDKTQKVSIKPGPVPETDTVDDKLSKSSEEEEKLQEQPTSFQETESLATSSLSEVIPKEKFSIDPITSEISADPGKRLESDKQFEQDEQIGQQETSLSKEKLALGSITSGTPMDSKMSLQSEEKIKSDKEQGEVKEVQPVKEAAFAPKEDKSEPFVEKESRVEPDILIISEDEEKKEDVTEGMLTSRGVLEEAGGERYTEVSPPLFTSIIDTMDDSDDSDSSSDISRKTTLTTRPYHTPRHRARSSPEKDSTQTMLETEMQKVEDEEKTLIIQLVDDKDTRFDQEIEMFEEELKERPTVLSKKDETINIHLSPEKMASNVEMQNVQKAKQLEMKSTTVIDEKKSSTMERTKETKLKSQESPHKQLKPDHSKASDRKFKDVERKKILQPGKKKSSSEESSEEKATCFQDITIYSRHRYRRTSGDKQSTQKDSSQPRQWRKLDEEQRRKQHAKLKQEKDKKLSCGEKQVHPKGEIDTSKAQPKYMAWYKKNREEMEKKRAELMATDDEEQLPRWLRRSMRNQKLDSENKKASSHKGTPRTKRKVKPLVNVESEQLKAIVRQGRKLRKAEGGKNEDPPVQIFATTPPVPPQMESKHHLLQHSEYKYEKVPPPFYLHPPPVPHPSPQLSPQHFEIYPMMEPPHMVEDFDPGIAITTLPPGNRLRHQQLLEKKSVFDIAYSEAAPSQLRSDSTTPPS